MTPQEIFDTIITHLSSQGKRAMTVLAEDKDFPNDKEPNCAYRTPDGLKCAFGILIPDSEYIADFETHDVYGVFNMIDPYGSMPVLNDLSENKELIQDLQLVHDNERSNIKEELENIADEYSLSKKVLNTLTFPENWS
jgi:hypothetical protein